MAGFNPPGMAPQRLGIHDSSSHRFRGINHAGNSGSNPAMNMPNGDFNYISFVLAMHRRGPIDREILMNLCAIRVFQTSFMVIFF